MRAIARTFIIISGQMPEKSRRPPSLVASRHFFLRLPAFGVQPVLIELSCNYDLRLTLEYLFVSHKLVLHRYVPRSFFPKPLTMLLTTLFVFVFHTSALRAWRQGQNGSSSNPT